MIVNHVFERMWKEADIAYSKATFEHFPTGTEKGRPRKSQSQKLVSWVRSEPGTLEIQVKALPLLMLYVHSDISRNPVTEEWNQLKGTGHA